MKIAYYLLFIIIIDALAMHFVKRRMQKATPPRIELLLTLLGLIFLKTSFLQEHDLFAHAISLFFLAHFGLFLIFSAALKVDIAAQSLLKAIRNPFIIHAFYVLIFLAQAVKITA